MGRAKHAHAILAAVLMAGAPLAVACGGGGSSSSQVDNRFLSDLHAVAPDIGTYRSDAQLELLGHAACDEFASGASYEIIADRLALQESSPALPSQELGDVITAAADNYCTGYRNRVS